MAPIFARVTYALIASAALAATGAFAGDLVDDERGRVHLKTDLPREERDVVHAIVLETQAFAIPILERLGVRQKSDDALRLRVYATSEGFEERKRRTTPTDSHWASAYFDPANNEAVTCWHGGTTAGRSSLRHELTHQVIRQFCKSAPLWFDEGFATYVGAHEFDRYGDALTTVDAPRIRIIRAALKDETQCPLYDLMELKEIEFYGRPGTKALPWDRGVMYAESWSLVFYLLDATHDQDRPFRDLLARRLDTGRWSQRTFKRVLPDIEKNWREFIASERWIAVDQKTALARKNLDAGQPSEALDAALAALKLEPERRAARRVVAEACLVMCRYDECVDACAALLSRDPDDADAHLLTARALVAKATAGQSADVAATAVAPAERAIERLPTGRRYEACVVLIAASRLTGDVAATLAAVRRTLKQNGVPAELRRELLDEEQRLIKASIGRGS